MTIQQLETRYGTMHVPDTDSGQYWWLANTGASPEDDFIEEICKLLDERPKATAIDVGANFGCWTLALSPHAHSVLAIEPQTCCANLIKQSVSISRIRNVRIVMAAAGASPGVAHVPEVDLNIGTNFGGISLLDNVKEQPEAKWTSVPIVRIDDLVRGEQVSFIKADVEGYEDRVIHGALETIHRCKPILFFEVDHERTNKDRMRRFMQELEYETLEMGGNFLAMAI